MHSRTRCRLTQTAPWPRLTITTRSSSRGQPSAIHLTAAAQIVLADDDAQRRVRAAAIGTGLERCMELDLPVVACHNDELRPCGFGGRCCCHSRRRRRRRRRPGLEIRLCRLLLLLAIVVQHKERVRRRMAIPLFLERQRPEEGSDKTAACLFGGPR